MCLKCTYNGNQFEDADYCAIQNGGLMAIPDGGPLSTVGRRRGCKNMARILVKV